MTIDPAAVDDVSPRETWTRLKADRESILVDVRTRAEWVLVGLPDLAEIGKQVATIEWQTFPEGRVDPGFADRLASELEAAGVAKEAELFFVCRSGARSKAAALAMTEKGFTRCHNVADGFEGPPDGNRQRGRVAGWKASGLPWVQS